MAMQQLQFLAQTILWQELEDAADIPEEADLHHLCQMLDHAITLVSEESKLKVGGEAIALLADIYASRANALLDAWETNQSIVGPVLTSQGLADLLIRQSMRVDLSDLIQVPQYKHKREKSKSIESIVGPVEKDILLEVLDSKTLKREALEVAHSEDISAWIKAIRDYFSIKQQRTVLLPELVKENKELSLTEIWLALLLSDFVLEQRGEFYNINSIWVKSYET